jgi:5'-nucleotidase
MDSERTILVVNDDGITAKGIRSLVEVAKKFGQVVVVAPDKPQSGMGHAVTINGIIRAQEQNIFGEGVQAYSCTGTPAGRSYGRKYFSWILSSRLRTRRRLQRIYALC